MNKVYLALDNDRPCILIQRDGDKTVKIYSGGTVNLLSGNPKEYAEHVVAELSAGDFVTSCVEGWLEGEGKTLDDYNVIPF
jgi:hypothetical protein